MIERQKRRRIRRLKRRLRRVVEIVVVFILLIWTLSTLLPNTLAIDEIFIEANAKEKVIESIIESSTEVTSVATGSIIIESYENESSEDESSISNSDVYLLAQIMTAEAAGCGETEMMLVGQVVLNRCESEWYDFDDVYTIWQVVSQKGQYPETLEKIQNGIEPTYEAVACATELLEMNAEGEYFVYNGMSTENILWQTGFIPDWDVTVVFETEWHVYSTLCA